jgi:riboflavin transporter FmnP
MLAGDVAGDSPDEANMPNLRDTQTTIVGTIVGTIIVTTVGTFIATFIRTLPLYLLISPQLFKRRRGSRDFFSRR